MANTISVFSTVAQAQGYEVEVKDTVLFGSRYFPTTAGDEFAGKEVSFDFEDSDLKKGAFLSSGYKTDNTTSWTSNSVIPPRVGSADVVDPKDQDRQVFERLCRAQGADLDRTEAYQNLLTLKSVRLATRTDRSKELLAALVLKEGKIEFDQDKDESGSDTDHIVCKFYNPTKGADNHYVPEVAWGAEGAHPYDDICTMVTKGMQKGRRYADLVLGANAWVHLSNDEKFKSFAGSTFHSEGMMLDFGDIEGANHVAQAVFAGLKLDVIVYSGAYKNAEGEMQMYLEPDAVILISEGIGRGLQGGCTLLNPEAIGYGIDNAFVGMTGVHMQSIYKDFNNQKLYIREESRPLPAPKHSVNEFDWIYCDTSMSITGGAFGEVANGISFDGDKASGYSCADTVVVAGREANVTGAESGTTFKAVREGKPSGDPIKLSGGKMIVPVDADRDAAGKIIIYATAAG